MIVSVFDFRFVRYRHVREVENVRAELNVAVQKYFLFTAAVYIIINYLLLNI